MPDNIRTIAATLSAIVFGLMTLAMLFVALLMSRFWGILLAIVFGLMTLGSVWVLVQKLRQQSTGLQGSGLGRQEEARVLKLAAANEGRLTAEETALECDISVEQARLLLDHLVQQGSADTWVSDGGAMVYVFQGLLEDEKASAEDPMNLLEP